MGSPSGSSDQSFSSSRSANDPQTAPKIMKSPTAGPDRPFPPQELHATTGTPCHERSSLPRLENDSQIAPTRKKRPNAPLRLVLPFQPEELHATTGSPLVTHQGSSTSGGEHDELEIPLRIRMYEAQTDGRGRPPSCRQRRATSNTSSRQSLSSCKRPRSRDQTRVRANIGANPTVELSRRPAGGMPSQVGSNLKSNGITNSSGVPDPLLLPTTSKPSAVLKLTKGDVSKELATDPSRNLREPRLVIPSAKDASSNSLGTKEVDPRIAGLEPGHGAAHAPSGPGSTSCSWLGSFEVTGGFPGSYHRIEAYTSSIATEKVRARVSTLGSILRLEEVARACEDDWPKQSNPIPSPPTANDVDLVFLPRLDHASRPHLSRRHYMRLVKHMRNNDRVLMGHLEGAKIIISPSHVLPPEDRCYKYMYFLWGAVLDNSKKGTARVDVDAEGVRHGAKLEELEKGGKKGQATWIATQRDTERGESSDEEGTQPGDLGDVTESGITTPGLTPTMLFASDRTAPKMSSREYRFAYGRQ